MHYIGIDIGTSSICGVAYNPATKTSSTVTKANLASVITPNPDEKAQNPTVIMECVHEVLDELMKTHEDVRAIGISGQMHGILYVDKYGKALSPLFTWQDGRGNRTLKDNLTYAGYLSEITGYPSATGYGLVTHFYNSRNGLLPNDAYRICTVMDYVAMQLTGRKTPLMDCSNAASLGFFDKKLMFFDRKALSRAGISSDILPEVTPSVAVVGYFKKIPVYTAVGDNQAAFIGSVRERSSAVHISVGTSSQISVYSPEFIEIPYLDTRPMPGGGYIVTGAELCGGCSFAILKDFFAEAIRLICGQNVTDSDIYAAMTSVPYIPDSSLNVETLFNGTRMKPDKRGKITGISTSNFLPQEIISGFARGICDALYFYYRRLPASIVKGRTHIVASGNGFRKNPLLKSAFEHCFGLPVYLSPCPEEAAFGAAVLPMLLSHP